MGLRSEFQLSYLLLSLAGTGVLGRRGRHFLLHHTCKTLLRLRVKRHGALRQLLDAHCVVPLSGQHVLVKRQKVTMLKKMTKKVLN